MKPLVDKKYKLEKFPGKGGWTYARVPEVLKSNANPFGWVKVMGSIDGVEIRHFHLMPMGDGTLMLPVKADIRKKIKKEAGDEVHIVLYPETGELEIPGEMQLCLKDEPAAHSFFTGYQRESKSIMCNGSMLQRKMRPGPAGWQLQ